MPSNALEHHTVRAKDGTTLTYYDSGGDGPPVVIANGLGGPLIAWKHQIEYLRYRFRVVSWDYRGLHRSSRPPGSPPRVCLEAQVEDLGAVLHAAQVSRAAFMGWSTGAQIALGLHAQSPEQVSHLVLLNPTFGKAEGGGLPWRSRLVSRMLGRAHRMHRLGSRLVGKAGKSPELLLWLKRAGLVGPTLDEELFSDVALGFGELDLDVFLLTLRALGEAAPPRVDAVQVPTLAIIGEKDIFTPLGLAREMAGRIPGVETLLVRGATHYAAIEYPELINLRIEKFFRENGYG